MRSMLNMDETEYENLCINAHNLAKDFTWDHYMDKLLLKLSEF